jgi:hypothetical protein
VTTFSSQWGISEEQHLPIAICRGLRRPFADVWRTTHDYN